MTQMCTNIVKKKKENGAFHETSIGRTWEKGSMAYLILTLRETTAGYYIYG